MPRNPENKPDLIVIGTARKPNASDLRTRRLSGLPDADPDVALRRQAFEEEQVDIWAGVGEMCGGEGSVSFLRTRIEEVGERGGGCGVFGGVEMEVGMEMEVDVEMDVEVERGLDGDEGGDEVKAKGEAGESMGAEAMNDKRSTICVNGTELLKTPGANEVCGRQKVRRSSRKRGPVQLRPYALERETWRRKVRAGRGE